MRVAFFGTSGPITSVPLQAVAGEHEVVLLVRPGPEPSALRRLARRALKREDAVARVARSRGIPCSWMSSGDDTRIVARLRAARADILCISSFRFLLREELLTIPRLGAINLHSSLLPRHRGAVPLFAIFASDDRTTGVTVHRVTPRADAGPILGSDAWPLERGTTAADLNEENARRGATLLLRVLRDIEAGRVVACEQDETLATSAPKVGRRGRTVDFTSWPAERVWHFLNGVFPYYREELHDESGAVVDYDGVCGWTPGMHERPGRVSRAGGEFLVECIDGTVRLRAPRQ